MRPHPPDRATDRPTGGVESSSLDRLRGLDHDLNKVPAAKHRHAGILGRPVAVDGAAARPIGRIGRCLLIRS